MDRGTFSIDPPGARAYDGFGIDLLPIDEFAQKCYLVAVRFAVTGQRNVKQEVSILAHDVDEHGNDRGGFLVSVRLEEGAVIVPRPNARVRLPGILLQLVFQRRFKVAGERAPHRSEE